MILINDNDWAKCKDLNGLLLFNINFLRFTGVDNEH
jgi:hypothetical protein